MKKNNKLYDLVMRSLVNDPQFRNSDKRLMWHVWRELGYLNIGRIGYCLEEAEFLRKDCPTPESITRCRRKIQELHPELQATTRIHIARAEKAAQKGTHIFREPAKFRFEGDKAIPV